MLAASGIVEGARDALFTRHGGRRSPVRHKATMVELAPVPADARLALQVSRWDRLKDPVGVIEGFAEHVADRPRAHLVLAGPATSGTVLNSASGAFFATAFFSAFSCAGVSFASSFCEPSCARPGIASHTISTDANNKATSFFTMYAPPWTGKMWQNTIDLSTKKNKTPGR